MALFGKRIGSESRVVVTETRVREYDILTLLAKAAGEKVEDPALTIALK